MLGGIKENKTLFGHMVMKLQTSQENLKIYQRGKVASHQTDYRLLQSSYQMTRE